MDDVAPQGGGTVLYPRTHRLLHEADARFTDLAGAQVLSPTTAEGVIRTELKPELKQIFDPISRAVRNMELDGLPEPVEFTGRAGDICIWHSRLFHRSCYNYSDRLRAALFYDVAKKSVDAQAYGAALRDHQKSHYHPDGMEGSLRQPKTGRKVFCDNPERDGRFSATTRAKPSKFLEQPSGCNLPMFWNLAKNMFLGISAQLKP